jgi:gluconate 2-dehydrogenase gamma chain
MDSRRNFLFKTMVCIPSLSIGADALVSAVGSPQAKADVAAQSHAGPGAYQPHYFTSDEWDFIHAACSHLIPDDDLSPGALAAGVPEFIDRQMETPYGHGALWYMQGPFDSSQLPELGYQLQLTPRDIYRVGIAECNHWCIQNKGDLFARLSAQEQSGVLHALEANQITLGSFDGSVLMGYLIANTQEGYFADPVHGGNKAMIGWKMIGFPGARADFMDWIDHPNEAYPLGPVSISGDRG